MKMFALYGRHFKSKYIWKEKLFRQLLTLVQQNIALIVKTKIIPAHSQTIFCLRNIFSNKRTIDISYFPHDTHII